ncbi:MAG: prepilin-type N-terminal cleavage/methylation domain-containing protein [Cryobacterium sp.]
MPRSPLFAAPDGRQQGFGMIEIVVSMFLLALLAIAFLPLLVQSLQVSVQNARLATATQLASSQIDAVRSAGGTCTGIAASAVLPPVVDERGGTLVSARTLEWFDSNGDAVTRCPDTFPATVRVSAVVASAAEPAVNLATVVTIVYVKSAG